MGDALVDKNQLEQIGNYVKDNIGQWLQEQHIIPFSPRESGMDKELLERMITVEQQLKFQNEKLELMMKQSDQRFEDLHSSMNNRFEAVDKRFEDMNKRFNMSAWLIGAGFTMITVLMSLYRFME